MRETVAVSGDDEPQQDPLAALSRLDGVASALAAARAAVDATLRVLPRRRIDPARSLDALVAATTASAALEDEPDRWSRGCETLAAEMLQLARTARAAPAQVLARMHLLLARQVVPEDRLGRVREGFDTARLNALTATLARPSGASAMVAGAIAHAELLDLDPFGPGSGIIARAYEHLLLIDARIDPVGMIMVEQGHVELAPQYAAAHAAYRTGTTRGVAQWLRHCAAAVTRGAERSPLR